MLPTLSEALRSFRSGEVRPSELVEQALETIEALDPELGAFVSVDRRGARRAAAAANTAWRTGIAGPLCGVPISVKDIIDVEGSPTGRGSPTPAPLAGSDATLIRILRAAGAVILGKVHLHEFALGITGENHRLGTPRNPHDRSRLPGGSSSGSAVSVAAGIAAASVATDTGGSVRVPAALCGVVGFKPSFGRISRHGVFPLSWSMDHVGVLTRTVEDARLLLSVLDREDPDDDRTLGLPRNLAPVPASGPRRIGVLDELQGAACAEVREAVERATERLADLGSIRFERASLPMAEQLESTYRTMLVAEAAAVHREALRREPSAFGPDVRKMLLEGEALPATDYVLARQRRRAFAVACDRLLHGLEFLLAPTTLVPAPARGAEEVRLDGSALAVRSALLRCTSPFSMVGLPALSLPCGRTPDGLPVGLQLVGRRYQDLDLLALAEDFERALQGGD